MKKKIIFILSVGRSGSTVLDKFLGSHSDCFSLGEINHFTEEFIKNSICSCGVGQQECPFWSKMMRHINQEFQTDLLRNPDAFSTNCKIGKGSAFIRWLKLIDFLLYYSGNFPFVFRRIKEAMQNNIFLYRKVFDKVQENILIDSSKDVIRALFLEKLLKAEIECKHIFLVRDGRATVNSILKREYRLLKKENDSKKEKCATFKSHVKIDFKSAVFQWKKVNKKIKLLLDVFKRDNYCLIKHEDFCKDPKSTFNNISNYLGVEWEDSMLDLTKKTHHMVGGNASRINAKSIQPSEEIWTTSFSDHDLLLFNKSAGQLNERFGYK